jgi:hypothetical protein
MKNEIVIKMKSQREIEAMLTSKNMKVGSLNKLLIQRGTDRIQVEVEIKRLIVEIELLRNILNKK